MKFTSEHIFRGVSVENYEKLYFDEPFNEALCVAVRLFRTLDSFEQRDDSIHRAVTVGPDREVPGPVAKVIGAKKLLYTEFVDYQRGHYQGTWKTIPTALADKVESHGDFQFIPQGDNVVRRVTGIIKVKLFGVGGLIEKFIVADVQKSYDQAASFTQDWIDQGKI
jgi:hypothetical protein